MGEGEVVPAPSPAERRVDVARAWAAWGKNAPLDLLDEFDGVTVGQVGPSRRSELTIHAEKTDDGRLRIVLEAMEDDDELDELL